jgi:hypothetical protein
MPAVTTVHCLELVAPRLADFEALEAPKTKIQYLEQASPQLTAIEVRGAQGTQDESTLSGAGSSAARRH